MARVGSEIGSGAAIIGPNNIQGEIVSINGESHQQIFLQDEEGRLTEPFYFPVADWEKIDAQLASGGVIFRFERIEGKDNPDGYRASLLP